MLAILNCSSLGNRNNFLLESLNAVLNTGRDE